MIESGQGVIDVSLVRSPPRPRSTISPALSRPPLPPPLATLFQGPEHSSNATINSDSPSSSPQYTSAELAQRMADIAARYDSWSECAELLIQEGNTYPAVVAYAGVDRGVGDSYGGNCPACPASHKSDASGLCPGPLEGTQGASTGRSLAPTASVPLISLSSLSSTNPAELTLARDAAGRSGLM